MALGQTLSPPICGPAFYLCSPEVLKALGTGLMSSLLLNESGIKGKLEHNLQYPILQLEVFQIPHPPIHSRTTVTSEPRPRNVLPLGSVNCRGRQRVASHKAAKLEAMRGEIHDLGLFSSWIGGVTSPLTCSSFCDGVDSSVSFIRCLRILWDSQIHCHSSMLTPFSESSSLSPTRLPFVLS